MDLMVWNPAGVRKIVSVEEFIGAVGEIGGGVAGVEPFLNRIVAIPAAEVVEGVRLAGATLYADDDGKISLLLSVEEEGGGGKLAVVGFYLPPTDDGMSTLGAIEEARFDWPGEINRRVAEFMSQIGESAAVASRILKKLT